MKTRYILHFWLNIALLFGAIALPAIQPSPAAEQAPAAAGDINKNFGGFGYGGIVEFPFSAIDSITSVGRLPDGTIAAAGTRTDADGSIHAVVVHCINLRCGAFTSIQINAPGYSQSDITALKVTPDGKIIVAGFVYTTGPQTEIKGLIARVLTGVSLEMDTSFNGTGLLITGSSIVDLLVQPDKKIVYENSDDVSIRLNENGSIDPSWRLDRGLITNKAFLSKPTSMAFDGDKVIVVGTDNPSLPSVNDDVGILRLANSGRYDSTFDNDGQNNFGLGEADDVASDVVVDSQHRIVVLGGHCEFSGLGFCSYSITRGGFWRMRTLLRVTATGSRDASYTDPSRSCNFCDGEYLIGESSDFAYALAIQTDDKVLASGVSQNNFWVTRRLATNGGPDPSFGTNGHVRFEDPRTEGKEARDIIVQPDGMIVVGGGNILARLRADGSFDDGGYASYNFGLDAVNQTYKGIENANAITVQPDGKVIILGSTASELEKNQIVLTRINPDGSRDIAFNDGKGFIIRGLMSANEYPAAIALQPDGKIVVAARVIRDTGLNSFAAYRFNANGTIDESCGDFGVTYKQFSNGKPISVNAVSIAPDGKIILVGQIPVTTLSGLNFVDQYQVAIWRLNANCSEDITFGSSSFGNALRVYPFKTEFNALATAAYSYPQGVEVLQDKSIIVGGYAKSSLTQFSTVSALKLTEAGNIDTTFGTSGFASIFEDADFVVSAMSRITTTNQLLFVGSRGPDMMVASLNANGGINTNWGSGTGVVKIPFGAGSTSYARAIHIRHDKLISVAGIGRRLNNASKFDNFWALAGLNFFDGSPVNAFSNDGKAEFILPEGILSNVNSITLRDNQLYLAGYLAPLGASGAFANTSFAVANFQTTSPISPIFAAISPTQLPPTPQPTRTPTPLPTTTSTLTATATILPAATATPPINTTAPSIKSISPMSKTVGSPAFTLFVRGNNFLTDATVLWNNIPLKTTYTSITSLQAIVPSTQLTKAANIPIQIINSGQSLSSSNILTFTVNNPLPTIKTVKLNRVTEDSDIFILTVTGNDFVPATGIVWNGKWITTTVANDSELRIALTSNQIPSTQDATILVRSPAPGGGDSSVILFSFDINNISPLVSNPKRVWLPLTVLNFGGDMK